MLLDSDKYSFKELALLLVFLRELSRVDSRRVNVALVLFLLLILAGSTLSIGRASNTVSNFNSTEVLSLPLQSHVPIQIVGDTGFTSANGVVAGTGTAQDPYVISGWDIKINSVLAPPGAGINIADTTKYFVIRNAFIHDGQVGSATFPGIRFTTVRNAVVENTILSMTFGIETDNSFNNIFRNNQLTQNENGFWLRTSSFNLLADNNFTVNCATAPPLFCVNVPLIAFQISNGANNTLVRNLAKGGIWGFELDSCLPQPPPCADTTGNYLAYNTAIGNASNGYLVNDASGNTLEFNQAIGNTDEGYLIEYANYETVRSNIAKNNALAGFLFQFTTGDLISYNAASGSIGTGTIYPDQAVSWGAGLGLFTADHNLLVSNEADSNAAGIALSLSNHNTFISNISHGNGNGFTLFDSSDLNVFDNNRVYANLGYAGFYFDVINGGVSTENRFTNNYVYSNPIGFFIADLYPGVASPQTNETLVANFIFGNSRPSTIPLFPFSNSGLYVDGTSKLNITGNFIFNNPTGLYWGTLFPGGQNLVYNNFFANPVNVNDYTQNIGCDVFNPCPLNQYNVTKILRTNVIGGPYTGGNYWSDYPGIDNVGDGLGHTLVPYQPGCCGLIGFLGGDYYPLVFPSPTGVNVMILPAPTPWTVTEGSEGTQMLAFVSRNGFAGSLTLSTTTSPVYTDGPRIALNATTVTLTAGLAGATFLNATNTLIPGTYALTLSVNGSPLPHTFPLTIVSKPIFSAVRGLDNGIYVSGFSSNWLPWQSISGSTASEPVFCKGGIGRIDLLVRGADNMSIWHRSYQNGVWSAWDSPGGSSVDQPACASLNGSLYLVVRGSGNGLWYNSRDHLLGTWKGWQSSGVTITGSPVLVSSPGRLDLIVQGTGGSIWHKAFLNGEWSRVWDTPGGTTPSTPSVASDGRVLQLVVRGSDNALWYNSLNFTTGSWSNWLSLKGATALNTALSIDQSGDAHLVVVGTDGSLWHMMKPAGRSWSMTWDHLGGITTNSPSLAFTGSTGVVIVRSEDGSVWANFLAGSTWIGWSPMGGIIIGDPRLGTLS